MTETLVFTMDPNLLVSVIKEQAGTQSKAIQEGVMNSIDAGASRVDVTVTSTSFKIVDNGRGFTSEDEIKTMFGRFGTPHTVGDALYGRFRMGRGQIMAFGVTAWRSGRFQMTVDINNKGLNYDLAVLDEPVRGCCVEALLYRPMSEWRLRETLTELRQAIAFTPKPVFVNGELFGGSPARLSSWTEVDEDAYYRLIPGADSLKVYNLGVLVEAMSTWRVGMGGIVVSKRALEVNFARNSVMVEKCPVWPRVASKVEALVMSRFTSAKGLTEDERKFMAVRLEKMRLEPNVRWRYAKVITDATGKHLPLSALRKYKRFVYIEQNTSLACAVHDVDGTFVVTESLLNRFSVGSLQEFIEAMKRLGNDVLDPELRIVAADKLSYLGLGGAKLLSEDGLTRREAAAFATLKYLNAEIAIRLNIIEGIAARELRVGTHKTGSFIAWTDGKTYITANRRSLRRLHQGVDGVLEWLLILQHEYTHDTDDSESHSHGEVFYRKFHDTVCGGVLNLASLARRGAKEYLKQLKEQGVSRPRSLSKQLRE